jgi:hypothetical protein
VGKREGKRPLGRPRHGWEDNSKTNLRNWDAGAWTGLIWLRTGTGGGHFLNMVMNLRVPQNVVNFFAK